MPGPDDAHPLAERYWYLEDTDATRIDVDPASFWHQLTTGDVTDEIVRRVSAADGWLVGVYEMAADMPHEEMHPHGDELHVLLSGRMDLVLAPVDRPGAIEHRVALAPGAAAAVPRGAWHRFVVHEPSRGIASTAGRGTEHRAIPPGA